MALFTDERFALGPRKPVSPAKVEEDSDFSLRELGEKVLNYAIEDPGKLIYDTLGQGLVTGARDALKNAQARDALEYQNQREAYENMGMEAPPATPSVLSMVRDYLDKPLAYLDNRPEEDQAKYNRDYSSMSREEIESSLREDAAEEVANAAMTLPMGGLAVRGGKALLSGARGAWSGGLRSGAQAAKNSWKASPEFLKALTNRTAGSAALGTYAGAEVADKVYNEDQTIPQALLNTAKEMTVDNIIQGAIDTYEGRPITGIAEMAMGAGIGYHGAKSAKNAAGTAMNSARTVRDIVNDARTAVREGVANRDRYGLSYETRKAFEQTPTGQAYAQGRALREGRTESQDRALRTLQAIKDKRYSTDIRRALLREGTLPEDLSSPMDMSNRSSILNAPFDYLSGRDNLFRKAENQTPYIDTGHPEVDTALAQIAQEEGVPLSYAHAIAEIESTHGENPGTSTAGARGVMQLMPETARSLGVTDRDNIQENIRGGLRYFKQQLEEFGNPEDAVRAYNAGPGNVEASRGWAETDNYVNRFNELVREYEGRESTNLPDNISNLSSYEMPTQGDRIQEQVNLLPDDFRGAIPTIGGILRDKFGVKGTISSAVRSEEHNAAVGGSPNSYHLEKNGGALDIVFDRDVTKAEIDSMVDYFKSTGAFKEVLYHDVGSGYHLHLGGYSGGLKGAPATSRTTTSARTSPNASSSIPETSQTSQPESVIPETETNRLAPLEEQYYGPQEKRAQQGALDDANTRAQQSRDEIIKRENELLTQRNTNDKTIKQNQERIQEIDKNIPELQKALNVVRDYRPPEFKSENPLDTKNAFTERARFDADNFGKLMTSLGLHEREGYKGLSTREQVVDKLQQDITSLTRERDTLTGSITQATENNRFLESQVRGSVPARVQNVFETPKEELTPQNQMIRDILVDNNIDINKFEEEMQLAGEQDTNLLELRPDNYARQIADILGEGNPEKVWDMVTGSLRSSDSVLRSSEPSQAQAEIPTPKTPAKTETTQPERSEIRDADYDDAFDYVESNPGRTNGIEVRQVDDFEWMDDPTRTNTQRIESNLVPKEDKPTVPRLDSTRYTPKKEYVPVRKTGATWEDVVDTVESHYGPVYELDKGYQKRGYAHPKDPTIGVRDRGDIEAIGHEVGHKIFDSLPERTTRSGHKLKLSNDVYREVSKLDAKSSLSENFAQATTKILQGDYVGLEETRKLLEQDASFKNLQEQIQSYNSVDAHERARRAMRPVDESRKLSWFEKRKQWLVQKLFNDKAPLGILAKAQYEKGIIKNKEALDIEAALSTRDARERLDQLKFGDPENIKYLETYYETKLNPVTFNKIVSYINTKEFKEFSDSRGYKNTAEAFDAYVLANYAEYYRKLSIEQVDSIIKEVQDDLDKLHLEEKSNSKITPEDLSAEEAILRSDRLHNSFGDEVYRAWNRAFNEREGNSRKLIYDRFRELLQEQRKRYIDEYKTVIDIPTAREIIDAAPRSAEKALKDFQQVIDNYYRIARQEGVISEADYKHMADNSDFFPALKNFSDIQEFSLPESPSVKEFSQLPKFDYRQPVQSPLTTVEATLDRLGRDTEKNRVLKIFLKGTKETGKNNSQINMLPEFFRQVNRPGERVLSLIEDGKPQYWQCHDKLIYDAISSGFIKPPVAEGIIGQALRAPAKLLRFTATNTAGFILSNLFRDTGTAFMQGHGFPPISSSIRAAKTLAKGMFGTKDADYRQLEASGFFGSSIFKEIGREDTLMDRYARGKFIERVKRGDFDGARKSLMANANVAMDTWERIGTHVESFNRAAAFFHELEGKPITRENLRKARLASQDISIDFSRGGEFSKKVNQYIPFFNASLQGLYSFYRAAAKNPREFAVKALTIGAISALYSTAVGQSAWYQKETEDTKRRNWLFRVGNTTVKIPKPYELGAVCNIFEHGAEVMSGKKSPAAALYAMGGDLNEALMPGTMPQAASLIMALGAGYDSFYGRPIDSPYNKSYKGSIAREANSWISNKVGKQVSPIPEMSDNQWDWFVRNTTGVDSRKGDTFLGAAANSWLNPSSRFVSNEKYTQNQQDYYNRRAYLQQQKQDGNLTRQEQRDYDLIKKVDADLKKAKNTEQKQAVIDKAMRILGNR